MLVENAKKDDFILGSRLMGGGFGGCTINLIQKGILNNSLTHLIKKPASPAGFFYSLFKS